MGRVWAQVIPTQPEAHPTVTKPEKCPTPGGDLTANGSCSVRSGQWCPGPADFSCPTGPDLHGRSGHWVPRVGRAPAGQGLWLADPEERRRQCGRSSARSIRGRSRSKTQGRRSSRSPRRLWVRVEAAPRKPWRPRGRRGEHRGDDGDAGGIGAPGGGVSPLLPSCSVRRPPRMSGTWTSPATRKLSPLGAGWERESVCVCVCLWVHESG